MARLQVPRPMNSLGIPFGSRGISWAFPPGRRPSVLGIAFRSQLTAPADALRERVFLSVSSVALWSISIEPLKSAPSSIMTCAVLKFPITEPPFLRSEEHTSELQSQSNLVCRLLLE